MDLDQHLNIFRPYARDPRHEDQLTRATIIVLKLVPSAHDALLAAIGSAKLSTLPEPRFALQTENLIPPESSPTENEVAEFVSVLLGPHEHLKDVDKIMASDRRARYDGVIQYGSQLLIAIESKLYTTAGAQQAQLINFKSLVGKNQHLKLVRWQELLNTWWDLTESEFLAPAEHQILDDFFDYAEANFGHLLPFTDLHRCGDNPGRRLQRLQSILGEATGLAGEIRASTVKVTFPNDKVVTVDRASLWADAGSIHLGMWPGELARQYNRIYSAPKSVDAIIALASQTDWELKSNFHLGYRFSQPGQRWYPPSHLPGSAYVRQWAHDLRDHRAGGRSRQQMAEPSFRQWLVKRKYATKSDLASLDRWLKDRPSGLQIHIRPGFHVRRTWQLSEAVQQDREGQFAGQVRQAVDEALSALGEPNLDALESKATQQGAATV